ncbi:hypothetical protein JCM10450v2_002996 [Rhodotorula kratochvilovae]
MDLPIHDEQLVEHTQVRRLRATAAGRMQLYAQRTVSRVEGGQEWPYNLLVATRSSFYEDLVRAGMTNEKAGFLVVDFVRTFLGWIVDPPSNASFPGDPSLMRSWVLSVHLLPEASNRDLSCMPFHRLFELHVQAQRDDRTHASPQMRHLPHIAQPQTVAVVASNDRDIHVEYPLVWVQVSTPHIPPNAGEFRYHDESERVLAARPAQHSATSSETLFHLRWFRRPEGRAFFEAGTSTRREKEELFTEWGHQEPIRLEQLSEDYIVVRFHR